MKKVNFTFFANKNYSDYIHNIYEYIFIFKIYFENIYFVVIDDIVVIEIDGQSILINTFPNYSMPTEKNIYMQYFLLRDRA